jgi:hypothetical protein
MAVRRKRTSGKFFAEVVDFEMFRPDLSVLRDPVKGESC